MIPVRERALELALGCIGIRETAPNSSPVIDRWLRELGLAPGDPWCLAFAWNMFDQSCVEFRLPNPLPKTGKVARLWKRAPKHFKWDTPSPGSIFCRVKEPRTLEETGKESAGHCGLVLAVMKVDGRAESIVTIEGNTDEAGNREGDGVMKKVRSVSYVNLGYIDIARSEDDTDPQIPNPFHRDPAKE